jgi:cell division protease FtsH
MLICVNGFSSINVNPVNLNECVEKKGNRKIIYWPKQQIIQENINNETKKYWPPRKIQKITEYNLPDTNITIEILREKILKNANDTNELLKKTYWPPLINRKYTFPDDNITLEILRGNLFDDDDEEEFDQEQFEKNLDKDLSNDYKRHMRRNAYIIGLREREIPGEVNKPSENNKFEIIRNPTHNFSHIGGYYNIKEELMQVADILVNYTKYAQFDVRPPKGLILEGPPGNGKTLLAKGFSGEANACFLCVSGADFVNKYVGVGAATVRELFDTAKKNIPCIVFIDEIDALGKKRSDDAEASNAERDTSLNQLLVCLDGFSSTNGIFVIGATNRYDMLDPALVRAGRIDKHIYVPNPDEETREEIIKIHSKKKPLAKDVEFDYMMYLTDGFSCSQIENLLNEAMLHALRNDRYEISQYDLDEMVNRIISGSQTSKNNFQNIDIDTFVIHELGHAIVGLFSRHHKELTRVVINLNSPKSPGFTVFKSDRTGLHRKESLSENLAVLLAGRIAEEFFFGESITTGASHDFERALDLCKEMVKVGMGKRKIHSAISDKYKILIDEEISDFISTAESYSYDIIKKSLKLILRLAPILKQNKILQKEEIVRIIYVEFPELYDMYLRNNNEKYYEIA